MKNSTISHFRFGALFLLSLCFLLACSKDPMEKEEILSLNLKAENTKDTTLIEGQYIVILSTLPGKKNPRALEALEALSKEVGQMPEAKITRKYSHALTGFAAKLTDKQVEKLKKDPRVEKIEQDSYMFASSVESTSIQQYPDWGLDRINQRDNNLDRVYSYSATGKGVTAYLVDTGIRYSHTEFGDSRATLGKDFVLEDEPENTDPSQGEGEDCWGIGTSVAAVLGGAQYGVAKGVDLVSVRVWGCEGGSPRTRIIEAVDWITEYAIPPAVVNMTGAHADSLVAVAIQNSTEKGIVYVGVAGNQSKESFPVYTADRSGILTVGASDINDKRASISNYGTFVDLYAPGESITSASNKDDISFTQYTGTVMSSPIVAGVAALYLELYPEATPAQVKTAIMNNSTPDAISDIPSGSNNLVYSLWEPVIFTPPAAPDLMLVATGEKLGRFNYANLTWNPTGAPNIIVYEDGIAHPMKYVNDGEQQVQLQDKGRNSTYTLKICEEGYDNCSEEVILVFGKDTQEPVNVSPTADFNYIKNGLKVQFNDTSTDPDGSIVQWNWDFGDSSLSSEQNPEHSYDQAGSFSVILKVTDDGGSNSSITKNITVSEDEPTPGEYQLSATGYKVKGQWQADLAWTPSNPNQMADIYSNGSVIATVTNTGSYTDITNEKGSGSLTYKICESGTNSCSNEVTVQF